MKTTVRRTSIRAVTATVLGAALVASSVLVGAVLTTSASASTPATLGSREPARRLAERAGWPDLLQLVGSGDHRGESLRQSDRRLHSGQHRPAGHADPGGPRRLHADPERPASQCAGELEWVLLRKLESAQLSTRCPRHLVATRLHGPELQPVPADHGVPQHRHVDDRRIRRPLCASPPYVPAPQHVDHVRRRRHLGRHDQWHVVAGLLAAGNYHHDTSGAHPGQPPERGDFGDVDG